MHAISAQRRKIPAVKWLVEPFDRSRVVQGPGDRRAVSADQVDLWVERLQPTLTTVRFDFECTTAYTQALLRPTLDGKPMPPPPGGEFVKLVERESVARLTR